MQVSGDVRPGVGLLKLHQTAESAHECGGGIQRCDAGRFGWFASLLARDELLCSEWSVCLSLQFHAMDVLFQHNYDIASAISSLVPAGGPVLCRDEMEEWSASEANLFEEALEKYGKDFTDIRQDFVSTAHCFVLTHDASAFKNLVRLFFLFQLPWKSLKNIIEYYYMWKTTDRYVQQKRVKAVEAESKLKQVYIPN